MWAKSSIGLITHRPGRDEGGGGMAPHRVIESAAFDPDVVALLIGAYEASVERVGKGQPLPVLEAIATRIIETAVHGERDLEKMVAYAIRGIEPSATG